MKPTLSLIVAMTKKDWVIGKDNALPWQLPEDLRYFKKTTLGCPIVMGRKTYESIGRPLPGRQNIILSRQSENQKAEHPLLNWTNNLDSAIALAQSHLSKKNEIFVIGGAKIFETALPLCDKLYITWVHTPFEGDTRFPAFELEKTFKLVETQSSEDGSSLSFCIYNRI